MAKAKKKGLSDVKISKSSVKKKLNPFEVQVNREKFKVLGRKSKFDRGLPGVSRSKAIKKRKETLLQEYKVQDKSNRFLDRRIGEKNRAMTKEDKIMARFTAERVKAHNRKTIFNLAEEEVLTHKGRAITEIEKYDDPRSEDEDEEMNAGGLGADFVDSAHFGGGMFTKSNKSRESVIDQLIADSKKRKVERQQTREHTTELTERLDSEWRDLVPLVGSTKGSKSEKEDPNSRPKDSYDLALRQLTFEAKGKPSDKLKSEEELAEIEAKRLAELEAERLRRMRGEDTEVTVKTTQHRSADDLDDNFDLNEEEDYSLVYDKEGQAIKPKQSDGFLEEQSELSKDMGSEDGDEEEDDEEEEEEDESSDCDEIEYLREELKEEKEEESESDELEEDKLEACKGKKKENEKIVGGSNKGVDEEKDEKESGKIVEKLDSKLEIKTAKGTKNKSDVSPKADRNSKVGEGVKNTEEASLIKMKMSDVQAESPRATKIKVSKTYDSMVGSEMDSEEAVLTTDKKVVNLSDFIIEISAKSPKDKSTSEVRRKRKLSDRENKVSDEDDASDGNKQEKVKIKSVMFKETVEEVSYGDKAPTLGRMSAEEFKEELRKKKEMMEKARSELPYTFTVPDTYEELTEILKNRSSNEVAVIVERMIKCNHPKLREENKEKMSNLFAFLMQHLNDLSHKDCWVGLDRLVPFLYDLTHFDPPTVANCLVEILKEKQSNYAAKLQKYPLTDTLVFLKLVPELFPTSDRRHFVTTPAMVFILQMLHNCTVTTRRSIASGLFLVSLSLQYVAMSQRVCPAAVSFLLGVLHLASSSKVKSCPHPPFNVNHRFLYLHKPFTRTDLELKMDSADMAVKAPKIDDSFRVRSLWTCLNLLHMFLNMYSNHPGASFLFKPVKTYLNLFEVEKYPAQFKGLVEAVNGELDRILSEKLDPLCMVQKKPKVLRLYEPRIEPVYETKRRKVFGGEEKAEEVRLQHKYKREMKGALREVRRDTAFLAKVKFKDIAANDAERIRKVNEIYRTAALQQGEIKDMERMNERAKRARKRNK